VFALQMLAADAETISMLTLATDTGWCLRDWFPQDGETTFDGPANG
jgi:hypothetical protein